MMESINQIQMIAVAMLPVLFAITLHEVAHGWVASRLGDQTAAMLGRLTINPLRHIDPVGTVLVPIATSLIGGFLFGWAKPVPVNPYALRRRSESALMWVSLAGPMSNFLMAILAAIPFRLGLVSISDKKLENADIKSLICRWLNLE